MVNGLILLYLGMVIFIGIFGFVVIKMLLLELIDDFDE